MVVKQMSNVRVGCCGFARGMMEYFSQFKLVEVQQTFYKLPKLETALKWRQHAPPDFEFTLKASQLITHPATSPTYRKAGLKIPKGSEECYGFFRVSKELLQAWEETKRFAKALEAKVIVFQCPPSFTESPENVGNLRKFFKSAQDSGFLHVWEPRGDWRERTIERLCSELELIHCVDPFVMKPIYGKLNYFRLHGGPRYQHHYSDEELRWLKTLVQDKETYVLFNNVNMYNDALAFSRLL